MNKSEKITILIMASIYIPIIVLTILIHLKKIILPKVSLKKILLSVFYSSLLSITFLLSINYINFIDYEKPIPYNEINRITFKNFRGLEFFKKELYGEKYFAYVCTTVDYEIENDSIEVVAYFHPSKSYVYDKKSNSIDLFTHEIYHFKITEIFARKIRKEITQNNINNKSIIENVVEKNINLENKFQKKYDYDTFHSYVYNEQKKYEKLIDSILNSLNKYKNSKYKLYEN